MAFVEASTRLGSATRVTLELFYFDGEDPTEPLFFLRRDSYLELAVEYYF